MVDMAYFFGEVYAVHGVAVAVLDMYGTCNVSGVQGVIHFCGNPHALCYVTNCN